jgi:hypothetical protein
MVMFSFQIHGYDLLRSVGMTLAWIAVAISPSQLSDGEIPDC